MSRLVFAGAGGGGREIADLVAADRAYLERAGIDSVVFIDDGASSSPRVQVVGPIDGFVPEPCDVVLCTLNDTGVRARVTSELEAAGARFTSYVHASAVVLDSAVIGPGAIVYPHATITCDVTIGRHAIIHTTSTIGHDVVIGDHLTLSGASQLLGGVRVGARVWFGTGATVLPGATIGDDARVGAGSLVLRRVASGATVFGNPAKIIARRAT